MQRLLFLLLFLATQATAQNVDLSNGVVFDGEPYLAINPNNAQHLVVAWMGKPSLVQPVAIRTRASFNGGQTWSNAQSIPHAVSGYKSADVSLAFNNAGALFCSYVDWHESPDSGGVYVTKSLDGGLTWGTPVKAIDAYDDGSKRPLDRPWLAVDKSSGVNAGTLYITTKPAPWIPAPNRAYLVKSGDGGSTWQPWQYVDTAEWLIGNFIQQPMTALDVSASGELHLAYPTYVPTQNLLPGFVHTKSTDGGVSFQRNGMYYGANGANDTLAKSGYQLLCDPSDANHLAFAAITSLYGDLDVFLLESFDDGLTWSAPLRVNDDAQANGVMQDLVWADFDTDGDLVMAWRDRRNASGTGYETASEIYGAVRWKDSTSFSPNFSISDSMAAYNSVFLSGSGNDFMNVQMQDDTMSAVWGDVRSGTLEIWFERMDLHNGTVSSLQQIVNDNVASVSVSPNPVTRTLRIQGNGLVDATVLDMNGRVLLKRPCSGDESELNVQSLKTGTYIVTVNTRYGTASIEFQKQ